MNHPTHFARSLKQIQRKEGLSLTGFADQLQMAKSTLQSILQSGQTTLDTACSISNRLQIPLSLLVDDAYPQQEFAFVAEILRRIDWYSGLPTDQQDRIIQLITQLLETIRDGRLQESADREKTEEGAAGREYACPGR